MMRTYNPQGATLVLTVLSENGTRLDRQAVVKLTNLSTQKVMWQTTTKGAEATFVDLPVVRYDVDVSAVGYLTGNKEISGLGALNTYRVEITLQRDPNSIDLSAPTVSQMPKKARNETLRGIAALTSGNLISTNRPGRQSPSTGSHLPPLTRYSPPCLWTMGGTAGM